MWWRFLPPVTNTEMPAREASSIVAETVVAPSIPLAMTWGRSLRDVFLVFCPLQSLSLNQYPPKHCKIHLGVVLHLCLVLSVKELGMALNGWLSRGKLIPLGNPFEKIRGKADVGSAFNDCDSSRDCPILSDHRLHCFCRWQVLWVRHAVTNDGALQGYDRAILRQGSLHLWADHNTLQQRKAFFSILCPTLQMLPFLWVLVGGAKEICMAQCQAVFSRDHNMRMRMPELHSPVACGCESPMQCWHCPRCIPL